MTQTILFRRGDICLVGDIILTVLEPLGLDNRQVVYFCRDKGGNKYRVPRSEVLMRATVDKPKKKEKKRRRVA